MGAFLSVMFAVFAVIFWIAQFPMDWIDRGFEQYRNFQGQTSSPLKQQRRTLFIQQGQGVLTGLQQGR